MNESDKNSFGVTERMQITLKMMQQNEITQIFRYLLTLNVPSLKTVQFESFGPSTFGIRNSDFGTVH